MTGTEMAIDKTKLEAQELHVQIMANGQLAASALLEFARGLKTMRDKRLYQALGYADFETYAEQAVGIRQRQAYNYISTLERLGAKYLEENAGLGISKLQLLAEIPANEREAFSEDNDLAGMSVAQIKAKIKEADDRGQQLSMLGTELADAQASEQTYKKAMERLEAENAELSRQLAEKQVEQPESPPAELDAETIEAIRRQAIEETKKTEAAARQELEDRLAKAKAKAKEKAAAAEAKAAKEKEEAVRQAREEAAAKAKAEAEKAAADLLAQRQAETEEATRRAEELAKQLELNGLEGATEFKLLFGQLQAAADRMADIVDELREAGHPEKAEKLKKALHGALLALTEQMEG